MKNRILAGLILSLPLVVFIFFWRNPDAAKSPAGTEQKNSPDEVVATALAHQNSNAVAVIKSNFARVQSAPENSGAAVIAPSGPPSPLQFTNFAPATVLENVRRAIRQYGDMFGGNPVGSNAEITAALAGDNPKHINFIQAEAGMRLNENGEMIDPWGTPFFFHQLSAHDMEIRSAGEDRKMWTFDDLLKR